MISSIPRRSERLPPPPFLSLQNIGGGARYVSFPADAVTVFGAHGPQANDVRQGSVGDCWLMAALASLAHAQPHYIRAMIRPTHLPTVFEVRLFVPTDQGSRPRWVRVDTRLAVESSCDFSYADLREDRISQRLVLWPALIEKAFALTFRHDYRVGYESLDGNHAGTAFAVLTGRPTWLYHTPSVDAAQLQEVLGSAAKHRCVLAGSNARFDDPLLQTNHYFTVLGLGRDKRVRLRDPHGFPVSLSLAKFQTLCDEVAVLEA